MLGRCQCYTFYSAGGEIFERQGLVRLRNPRNSDEMRASAE